MHPSTRAIFGTVAVILGLTVATPLAGRQSAQSPAAQEPATRIDLAVAEAQRVVDRTCRRCHNDGTGGGNLSLTGFDVASPERQPAVTEKLIRNQQVSGSSPLAGSNKNGVYSTLSRRLAFSGYHMVTTWI